MVAQGEETDFSKLRLVWAAFAGCFSRGNSEARFDLVPRIGGVCEDGADGSSTDCGQMTQCAP
jgi:hypothetical protein